MAETDEARTTGAAAEEADGARATGFTGDGLSAAAAAAEIGSLPLERLEREIGELAAHIHAATCRWLLLVAELDRREGWAPWGCRSCAEWLSLRCGVGIGAAREQVRVARRLEELPLVREAFSEGRLSFSKVRAISRVATPESEGELLELALHATAAQLERIVRTYRGVAAVARGDAEAAYRERYLSWSWEEDGSLVIQGRLPAEDGALLLRALEAARDELRGRQRGEHAAAPGTAVNEECGVSAETPFGDDSTAGDAAGCPPEAGTPRGDGSTEADAVAGCGAKAEADAEAAEPGRGNADALALIAEASLACSPEAGRSGGERYQLVVHSDVAALSEDVADGHCELEDGPPLAAETARRIACDAAVVAISERGGRPLSVGRKTRTIPPALRRALRSRDRCCRFPGCTQRRFVDAHHIRHWAHGGETELSNLIHLCHHHHRLLHEGGYTVERLHGGALSFRRPDGRQIGVGRGRLRGDHRQVPERNRRNGLEIDPDTPVALSGGGRFSLDMAIEGLLAAEGLLGPLGDGSAGPTTAAAKSG